MIIQRSINLVIHKGIPNQLRALSTTSSLSLIQKWRLERGLPMNPNENDVLTHGPDYTFLDGRLTPYGRRHKERIIKQREIRDQIIHLSGEIDFALDRYNRLQIEQQQMKQAMLDRKLKPKGPALLSKK